MKISLMVFLSTLFLIVSTASSGRVVHDKFAECIATRSNSSYPRSIQTIFHRQSPLFSSLLDSRVQNMRYSNNNSHSSSKRPQPLLILTSSHEAEIRSALLCCKDHGVGLRIRSGGHDYEGLSYRTSDDSHRPSYIILDLFNLNDVQLDLETETAWVQSGARLGELYYAIAKQSNHLAFPAGICPTVGLGGHIGGGGLGTLVRKYGLAADNVLDAYLMDARGRILNRKSMGEEVFWAIRGGGAGSFGIVLSWKLKLVRVPPKLTFFRVSTTLGEEGGGRGYKLIHKWQRFAHEAHQDLFVRIVVLKKKKVLQTIFESLFLGTTEKLIPLMKQSFPELGLRAENCTEGSWAESALYFAGFKKGSPLEVLLDKTEMNRAKFKAKSDFVTEPIPESGFEGMWEMMAMEEDDPIVILDPLGGRMSEIHESYTPFPHRKGNLYNIQYLVKWEGGGAEKEKSHLEWMNKLYDYMEPYVSKSPRAAYLNYRDLDLGTNSAASGKTGVWGVKYFGDNFKRLSEIKSKFDPENFFKYEQSIPPLVLHK